MPVLQLLSDFDPDLYFRRDFDEEKKTYNLYHVAILRKTVMFGPYRPTKAITVQSEDSSVLMLLKSDSHVRRKPEKKTLQ